MKKYYLFIITSIILSTNILFSILLLESNIIIKVEYVIYFYSWLSSYITFFYALELKRNLPDLNNIIYYSIMPINRKSLLLNEIFNRIFNYKFIVVAVSSSIALLIFGMKAGISFFYLIVSLILTIAYNSIIIILIKNNFNSQKGLKFLQIYSQVIYLIAVIPYLVIIMNKGNFNLDVIAKYNPLGGLFLSIFVYGNNMYINIIIILLSLIIIFAFYKKVISNEIFV